MQTIWQDLRYSARLLLKNPGFTLIAILTLALGIGANTAIFSVVNGVLLRPLAYHEPENIVTLLNHGRGPVSPANYLDLRANSQSFEQMSVAEAWRGTLTNNDRPEIVAGLRMGDGMFDLLGIPPLMGRTFQPDDFQAGKDHVLVLSHKLWQRAFGGEVKVVGRQITLNNESYSIVGVMPPEFQFPPFWSTRAEMWAPLDLSTRATSRGGSSLRVFARLKPNVSQQQANAEVETISKQLETAYPGENTGMKVRVDALNEKVVGNVRPALLALTVTVCFVLLIACANVACLLLARSAARQKEAALRVALGAGRWRIVRQLLTESLMLSLLGAAVGILLAVWGVDWVTTLLSGDSTSFSVKLPRLNEIKLDATALGFTFAVSLVTSVLFGLAPALAASKPDLNQVMKEGSRSQTGGRHRLRESLVVAEIALALVLLIGAGLLVNSFAKLQAVDPGFNPENLLTLTVSVNGMPQYVGPAREAFYRQLTDRLSALPGVESASAINHLPLAGDLWGRAVVIEGRPLPPPGQEIPVAYRISRPGYLHTMGISLRAGRDFTERDIADAPDVVIINETLAKHQWPSEDPIGKRFTLDDPRSSSPAPRWRTVVGVIKDVKQDSWVETPDNEIYLPFAQSADFYAGTAGHLTSMTMVVRTTVAPLSLVPGVKDAVSSLDRNVPVSGVVSLDQVVTDTLWQQRFNLQLIGLFAALAMVLAAIGLYGVMSYSVTQRTHEVGLRMALGAEGRDVVKMMVGQGMKLALAGVGIGLLAAFGLTRLMEKLLFGVSTTDPLTFAGIALLLTLIALLACWIPARRAAKVDPMIALRCE